MTDNWITNGVFEIGVFNDIIWQFITAILSDYLQPIIRGNLLCVSLLF